MTMPLHQLLTVPLEEVPLVAVDHANSPVRWTPAGKKGSGEVRTHLSSFLESPICEAIEEVDEAIPSPQLDDASVSARSSSLDMLRKASAKQNKKKSRFSEMLGPVDNDDDSTITGSVTSSLSGSMGSPRRSRRKAPFMNTLSSVGTEQGIVSPAVQRRKNFESAGPPASPLRSPRKNTLAPSLHLTPKSRSGSSRRKSTDIASPRKVLASFAPPMLDDFIQGGGPSSPSRNKQRSRTSGSKNVFEHNQPTQLLKPLRKPSDGVNRKKTEISPKISATSKRVVEASASELTCSYRNSPIRKSRQQFSGALVYHAAA